MRIPGRTRLGSEVQESQGSSFGLVVWSCRVEEEVGRGLLPSI